MSIRALKRLVPFRVDELRIGAQEVEPLPNQPAEEPERLLLGFAVDQLLTQVEDAFAALRRGRNPYSLTTPNIYGDSLFYGPGLVVDGRLQVGFPYFPLGLLLVAPGQLLAGDYRYGELAAMNIAAILMAFAGPRRGGSAPLAGPVAAALFLTTPRIFFVLDQ